MPEGVQKSQIRKTLAVVNIRWIRIMDWIFLIACFPQTSLIQWELKRFLTENVPINMDYLIKILLWLSFL